MRTVLLFAFAWIAIAQPRPAQVDAIERQEQRLVDVPDDVPTRVGLIKAYFSKPTFLAPEKAAEARRLHIFWLIEHHPDLPELGQPVGTPDPADADAQSAWMEQAGKADAAPKTLANAAAFFLQMTDVAKARAAVEAAWRAHSENSDLAAAQGAMDVLTMVGATRKENPRQITVPDPAAVKSAQAVKARHEIENSDNASLEGGAGRQMSQIAGILIGQNILGDEDPLRLALAWSSRAHELDPNKAAWTESIVQIYQALAGGTLDARGKVQWLEKGWAMAGAENLQLNILPDLMNAELEAGDDASAEKDAHKLLALAETNPKRGNHDDLVHAARTVLGRAAFDRGEMAEAKEQLLASARVKGSGGLASGGPRLTLAQELYDRGERDVVVEYLEACRAFWIYDQGKLDHYLRLAKGGKRDVFANWAPPGTQLVGHPAPVLKSGDWARELAGKAFALIFSNPSCKACGDQLAAFAKEASALDMTVVAVEARAPSGEPTINVSNEAIVKVNPHRINVPGTASAELIRLYEVDTYPTVVVIDAEGRVAGYRVGMVAPGQEQVVLKSAVNGHVSAPILIPTPEQASGKVRIRWQPVDGALSYVVEWEPRERQAWPSDKDGLLRVIPTKDPEVDLDSGGSFRWRVYGVGRSGAGVTSAWQTVGGRNLQ
jgi:tetratricopeptide (TPR) repeat protein